MKPAEGNWEARQGDTFHANRPFGVVVPLTREECIEIDGDDSGFGHRTIVIAEVTDGPTAEADAKLMAAAKDLLEALELMLVDGDYNDAGDYVLPGECEDDEIDDEHGSEPVWLRKAEAAIKKARGKYRGE